MAPVISIIIPAHNEENYIRQTLHSIKNQTFQDFETVVVANGCTDKTEEIVSRRTNEKLRLLSLPKANVSVARNAGALNANGKILLFLDADTQLETNSLLKINQQFLSGHSLGITKVNPDNGETKFKMAMSLKNLFNGTNLYPWCSGAIICNKEDFQKIGGYDPELTIKEHRKLFKALKPFGKSVLIDTYVTTSMRRFRQWGLAKSILFWANKTIENSKNKEYEKIR